MENEKQVEIDLFMLWSIFVKNIKPIIAITLMGTILGFVISSFVIDEKYTAKSKVLVQMDYVSDNPGQELNALSAAQKLVENCKIIFKSDRVITQIVDRLDNQFTEDDLRSMIAISSETQTGFVNVSVTSKSAETAELIANLATEIGRAESMELLNNASITTLDKARLPKGPSSPNVKINTAIGFVAGLLISFFIFLLIDLLDNKVKGADDLSGLYKIPLLADIPDLNAKTKENYRYAKDSWFHYYSKKI